MYKKFFGLHQKPFSVTPDPAFFYPSASHRDGLANLRYGIRERMGFVVLTGEVGIGKTFLIRSLLRELGQDVKRALIFNPILEPDEMFNAILRDLEVPFEKDDGFGHKLEAFNEFLLEEYNKNCLVVVIIDESQNLSADALERLRLLSNLETATSKLLQIILVGQPELEKLLALPAIRQLNQRVTIRHDISPLSAAETPEYIQHRLNIAGGNAPQVEFSAAASKLIYKASRGIPRLIGVLCDYSLLIAFTEESRVVTPKIVKEAIKKHQRKEPASKPALINLGEGWRSWIPAAFGAACLILSLGLTAWNFLGPQPERARVQPEATMTVGSLSPEPAVPIRTFETAPTAPTRDERIEVAFVPTEPTDFQTLAFEETVEEGLVGGEEAPGALPAVVQENPEPVAQVVPESVAAPEADAPSAFPVIELPGLMPERKPEIAPKEKVVEAPVPAEPSVPKPVQPERIENAPTGGVVPPPEPPSKLVDEDPTLEDEDPFEDPDPNRRYGIQVASFQSIERARQMADEVKGLGPVFLVPWSSSNNGEWVRVVLGVFDRQSEGESMLERLRTEKWGKDLKLVENRWWQQVPGATGGDIFALAHE